MWLITCVCRLQQVLCGMRGVLAHAGFSFHVPRHPSDPGPHRRGSAYPWRRPVGSWGLGTRWGPPIVPPIPPGCLICIYVALAHNENAPHSPGCGPYQSLQGAGVHSLLPPKPGCAAGRFRISETVGLERPGPQREKNVVYLGHAHHCQKVFYNTKQFRIKSARQDTRQTLLHVLQV